MRNGHTWYVVVQAIGDQTVSFTQALSVYLFSLAFSLIFALLARRYKLS